VTCTATNLCSTNTCPFNVTVSQIAAVAITCPGDISTNICGTSVAVSYADPTVSGGTLTGCTPASGSTFGLGTTPVTCTATNLCSTNTCPFNVTVSQIAAVAITCPAAINTNISGTSVTVNYADPTVTGGTLTGCTPASGSSFGLGTTPVTCTATNLCSTNTCGFDVTVTADRQVTGQVALQGFVGSSRIVRFVATGGSSNKTWDLTLNFSSGVANYTLTDVPTGTTGISAKTAWTLRKKLAVTFDVNGQATADFTGNGQLPGGDFNGDNQVNFLDYSILAANYFTTDPVADITGDGQVNFLDYGILAANYFTAGDPE
jgi:hypothetical protein